MQSTGRRLTALVGLVLCVIVITRPLLAQAPATFDRRALSAHAAPSTASTFHPVADAYAHSCHPDAHKPPSTEASAASSSR